MEMFTVSLPAPVAEDSVAPLAFSVAVLLVEVCPDSPVVTQPVNREATIKTAKRTHNVRFIFSFSFIFLRNRTCSMKQSR
jgi:hypothetical protein